MPSLTRPKRSRRSTKPAREDPERLAAIRAVRGKYAQAFSCSEDFARRKVEEIERENRPQ